MNPFDLLERDFEADPTLVVVGGHPGDAAAAAGGTRPAARDRGWRTVSPALNGGEEGVPGTTPAEAAAVRRRSANLL